MHVCHVTFAVIHREKVRVSLCYDLFMWVSLQVCVQWIAYQYLRYSGTSSAHLDWLSDCDLRTHARLLCFLTRQPDKLVVVWTRRSRRKSSKVCTEAKSKNIAKTFPSFCCRRLYSSSVPQSHSWQPGIKNPYRGVVVWPVPENIEITVTLFKVQIQTYVRKLFFS